jgi:hypothetical protein
MTRARGKGARGRRSADREQFGIEATAAGYEVRADLANTLQQGDSLSMATRAADRVPAVGGSAVGLDLIHGGKGQGGKGLRGGGDNTPERVAALAIVTRQYGRHGGRHGGRPFQTAQRWQRLTG